MLSKSKKKEINFIYFLNADVWKFTNNDVYIIYFFDLI